MKKAKSIGRIFGVALVLVLVGAMLPLGAFVNDRQVSASPAIIYVPDDYQTIQAAVNASSPGDTIIVRNGTYTENIDVNKDHLTIQSESGAEVTLVEADYCGEYVFEIMANEVTISGLDISGAIFLPEVGYGAGIYVAAGKQGANISNNRIHGNGDGICLDHSNSNSITDNEVESNQQRGVYLIVSNNNSVSDNSVNSNPFGINLASSGNNTISCNTASDNHYGICLEGSSSNNTVEENSADSNDGGIFLLHSSGNTISRNTCNANIMGVYLNSSSSNTITENNIVDNEDGIYLDNTSCDNIFSRNVFDSNQYGIFLLMPTAGNNTIYLNNFGNSTSKHVYSNSINRWNSPDEMTYVYNGNTYTGYLGNYWSDYEDEYTGAEEIDGTGIWNTPYDVARGSDDYPLVEPSDSYGIHGELNPSFKVGKYEVAVGEVVTFDATSTVGGTLPYTRARWDWEADGVWDEDSDVTGKDPLAIVIHAYPEEGIYYPCLEITDSSIPPVVCGECMAPASGITVTTNGTCGDVAPYPDCDGIVNMGDVVLLLNYVGHPGEYELCCDWCGDVAPCPASDGIINMGDVVLLLNYVGYPGKYHLCCE